MTTCDEFVRIKDVAGISPRLLARRVREAKIDGFRDPRDRRNIVVRRGDLARLLNPRELATVRRVDSEADALASAS